MFLYLLTRLRLQFLGPQWRPCRRILQPLLPLATLLQLLPLRLLMSFVLWRPCRRLIHRLLLLLLLLRVMLWRLCRQVVLLMPLMLLLLVLWEVVRGGAAARPGAAPGLGYDHCRRLSIGGGHGGAVVQDVGPCGRQPGVLLVPAVAAALAPTLGAQLEGALHGGEVLPQGGRGSAHARPRQPGSCAA